MDFDIRVVSVSGPDRPFDKLTPDEQEEERATFYIKPGGAGRALVANLRVLFLRPISYVRAFAYAMRLAGWNLKTAARHVLYFAEAAVFADWMRREGLSHVHMHFSSTVGLMARRILPMCTSVTIHGSDEFMNPANFYLQEKTHQFDLLFAISEYGRSQLMRFSDYGQWSKFRVSPLGVDPVVYAPGPFRENPSPFEILCVGRLAPPKGQHILIAALDVLLRQGRAVRLRFAGDGEDRADLEQDAARRGLEEHIVFEGRLTADCVRALYEQADIFALPSFAEGIPVVLMEAMAMELPCVASWITGIPELIRNEVDGLLVPPSNEEALAAALARLMDDPGLRRRLGKSGRRRVVEEFDLGRNTERFAAVLREFGRWEAGGGS